LTLILIRLTAAHVMAQGSQRSRRARCRPDDCGGNFEHVSQQLCVRKQADTRVGDLVRDAADLLGGEQAVSEIAAGICRNLIKEKDPAQFVRYGRDVGVGG